MKKISVIALCAILLTVAFFHYLQENRTASPARLVYSSIPSTAPRSVSREPTAYRLPGSATKSGGRRPLSTNPIEQIRRDSDGEWKIQRNRAGFVSRMSEGSLPLGSRAPVDASAKFLRRYGESLLGASLDSLALEQSRPESATTQIIYSQTHDGLPVFGSRLSLIFDREGDLLSVVSDLTAGPFPSPSPAVDAQQAAQSLRESIFRKFEMDGAPLSPDSFPVEDVSSWAQLGYRLHGGALSLVYRFEFAVHEPRRGEYESLVDANTGTVVLLKSLSRN